MLYLIEGSKKQRLKVHPHFPRGKIGSFGEGVRSMGAERKTNEAEVQKKVSKGASSKVLHILGGGKKGQGHKKLRTSWGRGGTIN